MVYDMDGKISRSAGTADAYIMYCNEQVRGYFLSICSNVTVIWLAQCRFISEPAGTYIEMK